MREYQLAFCGPASASFAGLRAINRKGRVIEVGIAQCFGVGIRRQNWRILVRQSCVRGATLERMLNGNANHKSGAPILGGDADEDYGSVTSSVDVFVDYGSLT